MSPLWPREFFPLFIFLIQFGTFMRPSMGSRQISRSEQKLPSFKVSFLSDFRESCNRRSNRTLKSNQFSDLYHIKLGWESVKSIILTNLHYLCQSENDYLTYKNGYVPKIKLLTPMLFLDHQIIFSYSFIWSLVATIIYTI